MLVEIWNWGAPDFVPTDPATYGRSFSVRAPADTGKYSSCCFHIDDADWRHMRRFLQAAADHSCGVLDDRGEVYNFETAAVRDILAAAEPYLKDEAGAG